MPVQHYRCQSRMSRCICPCARHLDIDIHLLAAAHRVRDCVYLFAYQLMICSVRPPKNVLPNEAETPRRVFASCRDEPRALRDVGECDSSLPSFSFPYGNGRGSRIRWGFVRIFRYFERAGRSRLRCADRHSDGYTDEPHRLLSLRERQEVNEMTEEHRPYRSAEKTSFEPSCRGIMTFVYATSSSIWGWVISSSWRSRAPSK